MINEAVFKIKNMFNPNDVLSLWIIKISMIRNDLFYVHKSLTSIAEVNNELQNGEMNYFFRLAASHYREAVKFIDEYKNEKKIQRFVDSLDSKSIENYKKLLESCTPWNASFVKKTLKPIRDNFFHYSSESFNEDFNEMKDFYSRIYSTGSSRKELTLVFADEISFNLDFRDYSEEQYKEVIIKLSEYMVALIQFVDEATGLYFNKFKGRTSYFVRAYK